MGHSFGFTHENIRPDATNYVLVLTNNVSNEPATTNLTGNPIPWVNLTNFTANRVSLLFTDRTAISYPARFYRVASA